MSPVPRTLARIVEALDRSTVLRRTADDDDPFEWPIVANADQLVIVTALADPPPRTGMIDRILVAGYDAGLDPLLCLTKADLASPEELIAAYAPLDVPVIVTEPEADLTELRDLLADKVSVLVGHSGVGKSTLVNALIPGVERATGDVNAVTGRGRHTSTSAIALELPDGAGWGGGHPRGALLRAQPRHPRRCAQSLPRSGRLHPSLPARLRSQRRCRAVRAGRGLAQWRGAAGASRVIPSDDLGAEASLRALAGV